MARWKRAVARAESDLVRSGGGFVLLDLATGLSGCFAPALAPLLALARLAGIAVLVPAILRTLAIRHAERADSELVKAIAVAVGVAAAYVVVRTRIVVGVCAL